MSRSVPDVRQIGASHPGPLRVRLRVALRVLRGHPTIYRVRFPINSTASTWQESGSLGITQCSFGAEPATDVGEMAEWVRRLPGTVETP